MSAPVVGVTAYVEKAVFRFWDTMSTVLHHSYIERVVAAGGQPVVLPPVGAPADVLRRFDALVVIGGGDVDPARYEADPHPRTGGIRDFRDTAELALIRAALDQGLPFLGICRGMQLLNVALGGTLHQHVPDLVGHSDHAPGAGLFGRTTVKITPGTRVAAAQGVERVHVPCHHHQSVDRLGAGLTISARAEDGVIEAAELSDTPFTVGVQWHPEEDADPALFEALVAAARP